MYSFAGNSKHVGLNPKRWKDHGPVTFAWNIFEVCPRGQGKALLCQIDHGGNAGDQKPIRIPRLKLVCEQ